MALSLSVRTTVAMLALALACREGGPTGVPLQVRTRWLEPHAGPSIVAPAVAGDTVYVGTGDGRIIARRRDTGVEVWASEVFASSVSGANLVAAHGVVVATGVREVVGLDGATGRVRWRYAPPPDTVGVASPRPGLTEASHTGTDSAAVYVSAWGASVSAVDLQTGAVRWVWRPAPEFAARRSGATGTRVRGDTVYAAAWYYTDSAGVRAEAWLLALDRRTGRELWRAAQPSYASWVVVAGAPAVTDRLVITTTRGGRTWAVDRATGQTAWEHRSPDLQHAVIAQAVARDGAVYVDGGNDMLYALDERNAAVRWQTRWTGQAKGDLLVTDRYVWLSGGANMVGVQRENGRIAVRVERPRDAWRGGPMSAAVAAGRQVFVNVASGAWSFDEP